MREATQEPGDIDGWADIDVGTAPGNILKTVDDLLRTFDLEVVTYDRGDDSYWFCFEKRKPEAPSLSCACGRRFQADTVDWTASTKDNVEGHSADRWTAHCPYCDAEHTIHVFDQ